MNTLAAETGRRKEKSGCPLKNRIYWIVRLRFKNTLSKTVLVFLLVLPLSSVFLCQLPSFETVLFEQQEISTHEYAKRKEEYFGQIQGVIDQTWVNLRQEEFEQAIDDIEKNSPEKLSRWQVEQDGSVQMRKDALYDGIYALKEQQILQSEELPDKITSSFEQASWRFGSSDVSQKWIQALSLLSAGSFVLLLLLFSSWMNLEENWQGSELEQTCSEKGNWIQTQILAAVLVLALVCLVQMIFLMTAGKICLGKLPEEIMTFSARTLQPYSWKELFFQAYSCMLAADCTAMGIGLLFSMWLKKPLVSTLISFGFSALPLLYGGSAAGFMQVVLQLFPMSYLLFFAQGQLVQNPWVITGSWIVLKVTWAWIGCGLALCSMGTICHIRRRRYAGSAKCFKKL